MENTETEMNEQDELTDHIVPEAEAEAAEADTGPGTVGGGIRLNHNETVAEDEAEPLEDLPVSEEHQEQIIGGGWGYGESTVRLNHNESVVEDVTLSDLDAVDDEEVKGGVTKSGSVYTVTFGGSLMAAGAEANGHVKYDE